jgi:hypothetical protein
MSRPRNSSKTVLRRANSGCTAGAGGLGAGRTGTPGRAPLSGPGVGPPEGAGGATGGLFGASAYGRAEPLTLAVLGGTDAGDAGAAGLGLTGTPPAGGPVGRTVRGWAPAPPGRGLLAAARTEAWAPAPGTAGTAPFWPVLPPVCVPWGAADPGGEGAFAVCDAEAAAAGVVGAVGGGGSGAMGSGRAGAVEAPDAGATVAGVVGAAA